MIMGRTCQNERANYATCHMCRMNERNTSTTTHNKLGKIQFCSLWQAFNELLRNDVGVFLICHAVLVAVVMGKANSVRFR